MCMDDSLPEIRIADADRNRVIDQLREHFGQGRLTLGEFEERVTLVAEAKTAGDLVPLTADLPAIQPLAAPTPAVARRAGPFFETYRIPIVLSAMLVVIWAITSRGYFWPVWPIMALTVAAALGAFGRPDSQDE